MGERSLQGENARARRAVRNHEEASQQFGVDYALLYDPQTAGGLLASVPAVCADACVLALKEAGYEATAVIGHVDAVGCAASFPAAVTVVAGDAVQGVVLGDVRLVLEESGPGVALDTPGGNSLWSARSCLREPKEAVRLAHGVVARCDESPTKTHRGVDGVLRAQLKTKAGVFAKILAAVNARLVPTCSKR
ncbi:hypothetical protein M885DRAFT_572119 [Pelagophyceae sp. CCMP2097]|nr:hypothetical protein M885DRAFT_572119 [Pelagophyceae sp. CCMP2097]